MVPDRLTVLYTACLRGRLGALPRLYTLIKRERGTVRGPLILLDLGESCTPDIWLCNASDGRAALVAMDAMGYDACYIDAADSLASDPSTFGKLQEVIVTPLVTETNAVTLTKQSPGTASWQLRLLDGENPDPPEPIIADDILLTIRLRRAVPTAESTRYDLARHTLYLTDQWDILQLGRLELALAEGRIAAHTHQPLGSDISPDPTISSVVEFVAAEAQSAARRRGKL